MARKRTVAVLFGGRSAEHEISILSARFIVRSLDPELFEPLLIGIDKHGKWWLQPPFEESEPSLLPSAAGGVELPLDARGAAAPHGQDASSFRSRTAQPHEPTDPRQVALRTGPDCPPVALAPHPDAGELLVGPPGAPSGSSLLRESTRPSAMTASADTLTKHIDVVFPVLHGPMGEDGTVQGFLELAGIPYVGSGVAGSAIGMDKDVMKRLLLAAGIPIPSFRTMQQHELAKEPEAAIERVEQVGYPLFVKPANLGSSVGVRRVLEPSELRPALENAFAYDTKAIVEQAVVGRELECAILGNEDPVASVVGEVVVDHRDGFYSYAAKYVDDTGASTRIPADVEPGVSRRARQLALRTFCVLEASGLARVDMFLDARGTLYVNEINTMPGFTAISMYPKLWQASGIEPRELTTRLIELGCKRAARRAALRREA